MVGADADRSGVGSYPSCAPPLGGGFWERILEARKRPLVWAPMPTGTGGSYTASCTPRFLLGTDFGNGGDEAPLCGCLCRQDGLPPPAVMDAISNDAVQVLICLLPSQQVCTLSIVCRLRGRHRFVISLLRLSPGWATFKGADTPYAYAYPILLIPCTIYGAVG